MCNWFLLAGLTTSAAVLYQVLDFPIAFCWVMVGRSKFKGKENLWGKGKLWESISEFWYTKCPNNSHWHFVTCFSKDNHACETSKVYFSWGSDSLLCSIFLECIYYLIFFHDILISFCYLSSLPSPTVLVLIDLSSLALCYRTSVKMVPEPEWGHLKYYWLKSNTWGLDWDFYFFSLFPHILFPPRFPLFQCIAQH